MASGVYHQVKVEASASRLPPYRHENDNPTSTRRTM